MRRSGEIVHDSARSPTSLVPVRSVGSTRISVLYCGAPGCSIANVSSWGASKLGGSAATTKSSSPPRRGVSWAAAGVTSSETRASAVRNVFMVGIILAPMKTIVALPGEGIGVEVVEATCALLSGAGVPVKIVTPPQISAPGSPVREDTQRACGEADAVLVGAAGRATTRVVGWLRWEMDAWAGVRPAKFYPGMRSPLADPDGIDLVVIRENSEGMYPGREGDIAELARALPTVRDRFGRGLDRYKDGRFAVKVVTRAGAARIARFACELARRRKARGLAQLRRRRLGVLRVGARLRAGHRGPRHRESDRHAAVRRAHARAPRARRRGRAPAGGRRARLSRRQGAHARPARDGDDEGDGERGTRRLPEFLTIPP